MRGLPGWILTVLLLVPGGAASGDDGVPVEDPEPGTPEHVIQKAFFAAQMDDFRMFYGDLCHRDTCKLTDVAMEAYRAGPWAHFRGRYAQCLTDPDTLAFRYLKRIPREVNASTGTVTYIFGEGESGGRMLLKRDKDREWKIFKLCE